VRAAARARPAGRQRHHGRRQGWLGPRGASQVSRIAAPAFRSLSDAPARHRGGGDPLK